MRAELATLALAIVLALLGCGERGARPSPPPIAAPIAIDPIPASFPALEALLARRDLDGAIRGRATLRLVAMLRVAARAGDVNADRDALAALRALVAADASALDNHDVVAAFDEALVTSRAFDEAYRLQRHVACPTVFPSVGLGANGNDNVQDHPEKYWERWEILHPETLDLGRARLEKRLGKPVPPDHPFNDEIRYRPLYAACTGAGRDVAEAWLRIARYHEEHDAQGGPFRSNRAVEAERRAIAADPGAALRARSLLGAALVQRGARDDGARELVTYLDGCARAEPGCDDATRRAAIELLGRAATFLSLQGARDDEPDILADDILDTEPNASVVEAKIAAALGPRLEDGTFLPRDAPFAPAVRRVAARTVRELEMLELAADVLERIRVAWPDAADDPWLLAAIGEAHRSHGARTRQPRGLPWLLKSVDAREALLAELAPNSRWHTTNAAAAVTRSTELAALRRTTIVDLAFTYTGVAINLAADAASDKPPLGIDQAEATALFARARVAIERGGTEGPSTGRIVFDQLAELHLAEAVVAARFGVVPPATWLAVRDELETLRRGADPATGAGLAARRVRLADVWVATEARRFTATHGASGSPPIARPANVRVLRPRVDVIPPAAREAIDARVASGEARGLEDGGAAELVDAAWLELAFGRAAEAAALLDRALAATCRRSSGFATWRLRVDLAHATRDHDALANLRARHGDRARTCAKNAAERALGERAAAP